MRCDVPLWTDVGLYILVGDGFSTSTRYGIRLDVFGGGEGGARYGVDCLRCYHWAYA